MITASELLGEIRPPKWRGPTRIHSTGEHIERDLSIASAVAKRGQIAACKREAAMRDVPLWIEVGAAVATARDARRMTQLELSKRMKISKTAIRDYEVGERRLPERLWPAVLSVLGLDVAAKVAEWRAR